MEPRVPDDTTVRVEADGAELEAPAAQAVTAVLEEGERIQHVYTAADFADEDYDPPDTRPALRGFLHQFAFIGSLVTGAVLIPLAAVLGPRAGFSVAVYCLAICGLFGISALYHRRRWSPRGWKIMKRLDHSMIFLFIAGTYTPFSLLAVDQPRGYWPTAPRWVGVPLYLALGWAAVFVLTDILDIAGVTSLVLLAVGGILYTVGAIAYAMKKPNPIPGVFGYHEVFHAMVIAAAICHYIAVYFAMYNSPFLH
jgi:hemolysin III